MRALPLLAVLIAALGLGLGLRVMLRAPTSAAGPVTASAPPGSGAPQGHVYTGLAEEPSDVNPFTTSDVVARRLVLAYTHEFAFADPNPFVRIGRKLDFLLRERARKPSSKYRIAAQLDGMLGRG